MEKPSLLPLLDARLPLTEAKVAEAARLAGVPLAQAWGVVRYYPRYRGLPQGRLLVDDPVARARGFEALLREAEGTYPPLGLEALAPVYLRFTPEERYVEWQGQLVPFSEFRLPFALGKGGRLLPPEPILDLEGYRALGGLEALKRLGQGLLTPEGVVRAVEEAGLLGRGGAAFPTHLKLRAVAQGQPPKYVVVNADESEPGNFKDRFLLEHHPFLVLEGALLAALAVGAERVYLYVREEFQAAILGLEAAIGELREAGLLPLPVEVFPSGGLYICGEETALLESMEGRRAEPRLKPPFPVERGLWGRPTLVQNVETLANLPLILREGPAAWRQKEPKLFSISGDVAEPGLYELPLGTLLGEALRRAGAAEVQAVLLGGAAGVFTRDLAFPLRYRERLPLGAGALVAFGPGVDLWEVLEGLAHFFREESCGKCFPCPLGTAVQLEMVRRRERDPKLLADLAATLKGSLCGLGQSAHWAYQSLLEVEGAA
ncbi:NADH-ubiquinone oxidoreductase-F iron-sulfur binding region domain-containing protein [Thermus igniterrae]|jgi:NADH:ubiquinone oxidoreductase subunit F (NADH-binding)|uniref:NADH-ubiquinone oxidoreductase-F iron-sulfur binding region domain-containing protein n=1 Tax=Thermus igniterrae TaxID=88189 RepID=UPI0003684724|nr:NADH-ubiquinone oxidoreductase-F iron-sulfur binding region domain-containing protein [Thermus igniterrae]